MAKMLQLVYPRSTYYTADGSSVVKYAHGPDLFEVLGAAELIRVHFLGHRQSSGARARLRFYESSVPGQRPSVVGSQIGVGVSIVSLRPDQFDIMGPFAGLVEMVLEIDDTAGSANAQEFDCEVHVTLVT